MREQISRVTRSSGTEHSVRIQERLRQHLQIPLDDLFARPRKEFRAQLVEIGFELCRANNAPPASAADLRALQMCAEAIEALHTGSLIIDDIQDQSEWRRGGPSLHLKYGLPRALNAGNWLYFFAFERLRATGLPAEALLCLYEISEKVLLEAHCGQALDVSTQMTQCPLGEMSELCRASLEMKSGALVGLALCFGGVVAGAKPDDLRRLHQLGVRVGVCLQIFDDVGNLRIDTRGPKDLEDLALGRPSFLWWHLAEAFPHELEAFKEAIATLPATTALGDFLERTRFKQSAYAAALEMNRTTVQALEEAGGFAGPAKKQLQQLAERLAHAYS